MAAQSHNPSTALVGCGRWGRNIGRTLSELGALKMIVDPYVDAVRPLAAEWGVELTEDLTEAFARDDIDSVAIAAPAADHFHLVTAALAAGKHVFVEKPIALKLEDAQACERAAVAADRTLMIGHLLQYHPAFIRLADLIEEGAIGEVRHIISNRLNPGAVRTEENALWSFAPHDFSMILKLTGRTPTTLSTLAARMIDPDIPDQFSVLMRFTDVLTAQVNVSWISPQKEHRLTVLGTTGALVLEDTATDPGRKLVWFQNYVNREGAAPQFVKAAGEPITFSNQPPLVNEMCSFLDAVRGGSSNRTDAREATQVLELLQRASAAEVQV